MGQVMRRLVQSRGAVRGVAVVLASIVLGGFNYWQARHRAAQPVHWQHEVVLPSLNVESSVEEDMLPAQSAIAEMFAVDANGQLHIDHETRAALEALWWELRESPEQAALDRMQARLREALPGAAGRHAAMLLGRYQAYQLQLEESESADAQDEGETIERQLQRQVAARQQHFDETTAALLFGEEEAYQRYLSAMMRIESDEALSIAQKTERLQDLRERYAKHGVVPSP